MRVELDNVIALLNKVAALLHPGIVPFRRIGPPQTKLSSGEFAVLRVVNRWILVCACCVRSH